MSLFTRIKNSIEADLHGVLDERERKNPIALLNQYLRQSEQEVEKVRKLLERQHSLKEEFTREYNHANEMAKKRSYQAEVASTAGETDLYEFVLQEQLQFEERANRTKVALDQANQHLLELEKKYEEMNHKLKDMYIRRMELMGRENIARANYKINQVLDESTNTSSSNFDEIERYIDRLEQQVHSAFYRNTIDARIAQLEKQLKN